MMKNEMRREIVREPEECRELPRTENSYPFGAADRLVEPIRLEEYGFEEHEYLLKGHSHVYEWKEGMRYPEVRTESAPYGTRILVRRPSVPKDFHGVVVVELMNWASKYDRTIPGWGHCFDYYLSRGIAWIGVAVRDVALEAMKRFDPIRYRELDFKNPQPPELRGEPADSYGRCNIENENGLIWDMLSQLGVLLKSDTKENPMYGFPVQKVMATGATAGDLSAYLCGIHPLHRNCKNRPIYDGFLIYMTGAPGGINQETNKNSELDERGCEKMRNHFSRLLLFAHERILSDERAYNSPYPRNTACFVSMQQPAASSVYCDICKGYARLKPEKSPTVPF